MGSIRHAQHATVSKQNNNKTPRGLTLLGVKDIYIKKETKKKEFFCIDTEQQPTVSASSSPCDERTKEHDQKLKRKRNNSNHNSNKSITKQLN